jgi:ATP-dependent RNA helicase RhlE
MHSEDYVHRIGRTGRAHAVGDAISFVTPEDHDQLRSLERFIGRGIVRKKADGFDYNAVAPPHEQRTREARASRPRKIEPRLPGNSAHGSGEASHRSGGRPPRGFSSTNFRPPRRSYRRHR